MALRFEFDPANKILLVRVDGRLTEESLKEFYEAVRRQTTATDAQAGIADFSAVTEFAVSREIIRQLVRREPAMPNATSRPRIVAAPQPFAYGLFRMFQIMGEETRPMLSIVHTLDEALAELGVQSPHFEPYRVTEISN
jgi:hypothetical protein